MKITSYLLLAQFGFLLLSCAPAYVPNKVNTGLFTQEGELHGEAATGVSGTDIQVAAAIPGNLMVVANASFKDRDFQTTVWQEDIEQEVTTFEGNKKHRIWELGAGYYQIMDDGWLLEAVVGYGQGNLENVETDFFAAFSGVTRVDENTILTESRFNKVFIQPTVGFSNRNFDVGFTPKFAMVRVTIDDQQFRDNFFEPTATMRFGHEYLKFTGQLGLSLPLDEDIEFSHEPLIFSIGIMADVNVLKRKKKEE